MMNDQRQQGKRFKSSHGTSDSDDGERALWIAVLHQARKDASRTVRHRHWRSDRGQGGITVAEQEDARAFLNDLSRLGPICELLDIDVEWFQKNIPTYS